MLTGQALGAAIEAARKKKKVTKKAMADAFGVSPPAVQDWVTRGTIDKARLQALWEYFSDVVGPEHWGLVETERAGSGSFTQALADWRTIASPRSAQVIDNLSLLAKKNELRDEDWVLLEQLAARFRKASKT